MRMVKCKYCMESYVETSSCTCKCEHSTDARFPVCDDCIAAAIAGLQPHPERQHSCRTPTMSPKARREINAVLRCELRERKW